MKGEKDPEEEGVNERAKQDKGGLVGLETNETRAAQELTTNLQTSEQIIKGGRATLQAQLTDNKTRVYRVQVVIEVKEFTRLRGDDHKWGVCFWKHF
jgi:hypothetical protein